MAAWTIGEGRADETAALIALWSESWQRLVPEIDFRAREAWFSDYLPELIRDGARLRVARGLDGAPLGFATINPARRYLDTLVTASKMWGQGVGLALLEDCKALSPMGVDLKVNQLNLRAIAFYERHGFARGEAGVNELSGNPLWNYHWRPRG